MTPRRKIFTFAIDEDIAAAMKEVKAAMGIPESEQARIAIRFWLGIPGGSHIPNLMLRIKHERLAAEREGVEAAKAERKRGGARKRP